MTTDSNISFPTSKNREPEAPIDIDKLNQTIDYIRPAVQADGGDLKLAKIENGVLKVDLPIHEQVKPQKIEVTAVS